jgi:hypothetical protein
VLAGATADFQNRARRRKDPVQNFQDGGAVPTGGRGVAAWIVCILR